MAITKYYINNYNTVIIYVRPLIVLILIIIMIICISYCDIAINLYLWYKINYSLRKSKLKII